MRDDGGCFARCERATETGELLLNYHQQFTSAGHYSARYFTVSMASFDLLILNGLVVTASDIGHCDIAIKDERIALLAPKGSLAETQAKKVIDAEGGYIMVRLLDDLVPVYHVSPSDDTAWRGRCARSSRRTTSFR